MNGVEIWRCTECGFEKQISTLRERRRDYCSKSCAAKAKGRREREAALVGFRQAHVCDCGDHGFVGLTRGFVAIFDAEDLPLIAGRAWQARGAGRHVYASTATGEERGRYMHRHITGAAGNVVDHRNHDCLDNRKSNIRVCSHAENQRNRSLSKNNTTGFKGVTKRGRRYAVQAVVNGKNHHLGRYATAEEAAAAYDQVIDSLHGEFASKNADIGARNGRA